MDIGEIELRLPTVTDINDQLVDFVKDYVMKKTSNVLVKISQQENLPLYCGSHENSRPYGEVETCIPVDKSKPIIKVRADIETC